MEGLRYVGSFKKCDISSDKYSKQAKALMENYRLNSHLRMLAVDRYCIKPTINDYPVIGKLYDNEQDFTVGLFISKEHCRDEVLCILEGDAMVQVLSSAIREGDLHIGINILYYSREQHNRYENSNTSVKKHTQFLNPKTNKFEDYTEWKRSKNPSLYKDAEIVYESPVEPYVRILER